MRSGYSSSAGGAPGGQVSGGYSSSVGGGAPAGGYSSSQPAVVYPSAPGNYGMQGQQQITYATQGPSTFFYRQPHYHHNHGYQTTYYSSVPDDVSCCSIL